jgi:hypothetical protein
MMGLLVMNYSYEFLYLMKMRNLSVRGSCLLIIIPNEIQHVFKIVCLTPLRMLALRNQHKV